MVQMNDIKLGRVAWSSLKRKDWLWGDFWPSCSSNYLCWHITGKLVQFETLESLSDNCEKCLPEWKHIRGTSFPTPLGKACRFRRTLYELKRAPRGWSAKFSTIDFNFDSLIKSTYVKKTHVWVALPRATRSKEESNLRPREFSHDLNIRNIHLN